jgi:hypothetical protein
LVSLKTQSAGDDYPKKEIEKTVLRFLGSRTFSHGLGRLEPLARVERRSMVSPDREWLQG